MDLPPAPPAVAPPPSSLSAPPESRVPSKRAFTSKAPPWIAAGICAALAMGALFYVQANDGGNISGTGDEGPLAQDDDGLPTTSAPSLPTPTTTPPSLPTGGIDLPRLPAP